ncbi:MAG: acyltransferase domain-containing protein, partial [Acidobacteriota bacterium]|nr:acyltransferase domain-containing protein [Acidobacteriota bacterium]
LGYSLGELVAACVAGVLELPDALRLVAERARLVEELPAGSMLAVPLPRRQVEEYLGAELDLAATDGSHLTVVSGPPPAVQALAQRLSGEGVACLPLEATHAFHSSMMQPAAPALEQLASELSLQPPKIPWISNLTGTWITDEEAVDPRYWACQLVATVRFGEGLEEALDAGGGLLMELGPGGNLAVLARQSPSFGARHRVSAVMGQGRGDEALALRQAVGDAWLAGAPVRWQRLWTGEQRQRRILPTYAFERERHWIDLPPEALHGEALQPPAGPAAATLSRAALEDCVWLPVWEQVAPASPVSEATGPWLLLGPEAETTELAAALRVLGETVVIALAGESFEPLGEHRFRLRPHSAEDIGGLLRELHESRLAPRGIAHLWTLPPTLSADSPFEGWEEADRWLAQGLDSLVALAQALASSSAASSATEGEEDPVPTGRLVVVSSGIQRVFGDEPLTPPKAALLGAVRAVDREVQGWRCRSVDLSAAGASGTELFAGAALARELRSAVSQEDEEIALRGRRRWRREFLQTPLAAADEARPTVRPGGTYWVTGGTQGLGLVLAEALARNPAKGASGASEEEPSAPRLVLLSDVQLPRADEWSTEIQRRGPQAEVLQRLQALRQACSELVVLDLGEQAPETLVAELERRFGIPDGIVHALDSAREGMVQLRGPDDLSAVGTQGRSAAALIDRFSAAREVPDFLLLCASASALTEGLGQIDYGAVSAYQTALAESREEVGGMRVLAVDWGPGRWQAEAPAEARGGGLETLDDRHLEHIRRYGLSAEETGEITLRLLATETVRAVVTAENLPAVIASARRQTTTAVVAELDALRSPGQEASRQQLSSDYVAPRDPVEKDLVQLWEELFGLRPIGVQDSFFELGGHSLLAIQALTRLRERTGIELPMTQLFDTPTIEGLALRIAELGLEDLDDDEMDAAALLLEEVRNLSPEEVQRRLGEAGGGAPLEDPVESSEAEE